MLNESNNNRYIPPPSPYKKSAWIDSLTIIYKIAFFAMIVLGFFVCIYLCYNGYDGLSIIFFAVTILIAVLTVGFAMVFLELAKDIRNITSYVHIIGAMIIEDKNQKLASGIENISDKMHTESQQEEK